jgi:bla regulator protein blaR1
MMNEYSADAWYNWFIFLMNHLWQSTIFSIFAWLVVMLLRGSSAKLRHTIWTVATLKFVLPSALIVSLAAAIGVDVSSYFLSLAWATGNPVWLVYRQHQVFHVAGSSGDAWNHSKILLNFFLLVWFTGTLVLLFRWFKRQIQFYRALRKGIVLQAGREFETLEIIRKRLAIKRDIRIAASERINEPGVWGVWKPIIVFPFEMASQLKDSELEAVLLHEVAHIVRYDNLVSNFQMMICSLFWFHPLIWWIDRQMLAEREAACDEQVMELGSPSKVYVSSLIKVLQFGLGIKVAGVSCAGGSNLRRRIQRIVSQTSRGDLSTRHKLVVVAMLSALVVGSVAAVDIGDCERDSLARTYSRMRRNEKECPKKDLRSNISPSIRHLPETSCSKSS